VGYYFVTPHFTRTDLVIIVIYFLAVLGIGLRAKSKDLSGLQFLLAGRTITLPIFVMTLVSTWYGGILGVGEYTYTYGLSNWVTQGVPYYFFAAIFALVLSKRVRQTEFVSIPDQLRNVYGKKTGLLGSFLTFIISSPASNVLGMSILLQMVTHWSTPVCIAVSILGTVLYLFTGGFHSDVQTDIFEFFCMFLGVAVILPYCWIHYGGFSFIQSHVPEKHLTWNGGTSTQFILVWFFMALWTLVDPEFYQRCFAAKSEAVAKKGILISIGFWFVFDFMTTTIGLYAKALLPNLKDPMMAFPALAEQVLPPVVKGIFYIGLFATVMSSLNSSLFVSAQTFGRDLLWRTVGKSKAGAETRYTRIGLIVTSLFAIVLSTRFPSIVSLWYTLGTIVIPGLLIPLITSYFPGLRNNSKITFITMLSGWLSSLSWFIAGKDQQYPLGIEPFFIGLSVSSLLYMIGLSVKEK